jgi:tetratricopeptide (TPR) repeat protein
MLEFFASEDASADLKVTSLEDKALVLNEAGLCLMNLGRLAEAVPFLQRSSEIAGETDDWKNASVAYRNLAELLSHRGALRESILACRKGQMLAHRAQDFKWECNCRVGEAWAVYLGGDLDGAGAMFQHAEILERQIDSSKRSLYSLRGIYYADYLRRAGNPAYARVVTEANLDICQRNRWVKSVSQCHRVLGDLSADSGQNDVALKHYETALDMAVEISFRPALIEIRLARGRWWARHMENFSAARRDLESALEYAIQGGYRVYEADIRVALAWADLTAREKGFVPAEVSRVRQISLEIGYHWGQIDAAAVLRKCNESE